MKTEAIEALGEYGLAFSSSSGSSSSLLGDAGEVMEASVVVETTMEDAVKIVMVEETMASAMDLEEAVGGGSGFSSSLSLLLLSGASETEEMAVTTKNHRDLVYY